MIKKVELSILVAFFVLLFGLAATRVFDWDIFWQLQSGKYIWQTQSMIRFDTFTLAAETPRWEHCWLHDLVYYAVWSAGGFAAMSLLKGALVTATAAVLAAVAWRRKASLAALLLVLPLPVFLTFANWRDRPQLWSYLGFALLLWLLEDFQERGGRRIFMVLPLVVLWANLHAGVLIVFPVLLAYCVACVGERWQGGLSLSGGGVKVLGALFPLLVGAVLLTPYGTADFILALKGSVLGSSSEMSTLKRNLDWAAWSLETKPIFLICVVGSALLLLGGKNRLRLRDLFLLAGLAAMGFRLIRHIPFFYLAMAALLPHYADAIGNRLAKVWPRCAGNVGRLAVVLLTLFLLLLPVRVISGVFGYFNLGLRDWHFPVGAAEFLRQEKLPGRIFNDYLWGGYLEWQLYPDYLVYWDARQNSVQVFDEGMRLMDGDPAWENILSRNNIDVAVFPPCQYITGRRQGRILDPLRADPDWALVYAGGPAVVFIRVAAVDAAWLAAHRLPDSRVDDVSLELTAKLLEDNPQAYRAHGERARIFVERHDYGRALIELERYLALCPPDRRDAGAVKTYQALRGQL